MPARLAPPLAVLLLLASGCSYLPGLGFVATSERPGCTGAESLPPREARRCNETALRQAVVAVETYYADNGAYAGMTIADLQAYDSSIAGIRIARASSDRYCIETHLAGATFSAQGPPPGISAGGCG